MFGKRLKYSQSICLEIIHEKVQCVWLTASVIDPNLETVLAGIELGDQLVLRDSADPHRIDLGVWRHKCDIGGPWTCTYFIDNHLFGRALAEHHHFMLRFTRHTVKGVQHIVLHEFRKFVGRYHDWSYYAVTEGNLVVVRVVNIVGTLVFYGVQSI